MVNILPLSLPKIFFIFSCLQKTKIAGETEKTRTRLAVYSNSHGAEHWPTSGHLVLRYFSEYVASLLAHVRSGCE